MVTTKKPGRARALPRLSKSWGRLGNENANYTNSVVRAVPKIFHYEARTIPHVDVILISS